MSSHNIPYEKVGKNEPVSIADEVPFEIPESWEWVRLGSLMSVISDGTHKTPNYVDKGVPFLSVQNISKGYFDFSKLKYITKEEHEKLIKRVKPEYGDILFCRIGTLGKAIKNTVDFEYSIFVSLGLLRPIEQNIADYIVFAINSPLGDKWIQENKVGGGTHTYKINLVDIPQMLIPLPPLKEQQRIFEKISEIEEQLVIYDKTEVKLRNLQESFPERLKKSILQDAVMGKLVPQNPNDEPASVLLNRIREEKQRLIAEGKLKKDKHESIIYHRDNSHYEKLDGIERCIDDEIPFEIPKTWSWVRLGSIGDWGSGATPSRTKPEYYSGNIPWLKTGDLNDGYIDSVPEYISDLALQQTSVRLNPVGSVLIAMYGATIGKLGITNIPLTTNQACCACLPMNGIYNEYLFYFLMAQKTTFIKRGEGGAQPNISKEKIIKTLMPVPPEYEQHRIVKRLKEILDTMTML